MQHLRWYALLALIVMVVYVGLTIWLDEQVTEEHEERFNDLQALQTRLSAQSIEDHFDWVLGEIRNLAEYQIPRYMQHSPSTAGSLSQVFETAARQAYPDEEMAIVFVAASGEEIVRYEAEQGHPDMAHVLLSEWLEAYGGLVRETDAYYVTPFEATGEHQIYGLMYPVYDDERVYMGILAVVLDFGPVLEKFVTPVRSGEYGAAWVQAADSYVIYDHEPDTIGQYVTDLAQPYHDLQRVNRLLMSQDQGQDAYHYTVAIGGKVQRKLLAWSTAHLGNQRLTIALSAPDTEINAELTTYRRSARLLGVLLGLTLIVGSGMFYATRQRALQKLVAARTQELKDLNAELEARVAERTAELTARNAELVTILETMVDGVIFRREGEIIYTNSAVTRLLGFTHDEIKRDPRAVYAHATRAIELSQTQKLRHAFQRTLEQGGVHREDVRLTRKNGDVLYASVYMTSIITPSGEHLGSLEIIHDISHEIALQAQKDRFITNASHELRRPLSNLKTRLYLLRRQPEQLDKHLQVLERATNDMADLVRDLVDVAQFTRDVVQIQRRAITLQAVLEAVQPLQAIVAARENVTLRYTVEEEAIAMYGDYQRLAQAFGNLITHAIHSTPAGKTVHIRLDTEQGTDFSWSVFRVADSGPTLSPEELRHVFDPFFRASEGTVQSTGLGLTLAQLIVEQHGGILSAANGSEGGVVFTVRLPHNHVPPGAAAPAPDAPSSGETT